MSETPIENNPPQPDTAPPIKPDQARPVESPRTQGEIPTQVLDETTRQGVLADLATLSATDIPEPATTPPTKENDEPTLKEKRSVVELYRTGEQFGELARNIKNEGIIFSWDDLMGGLEGIDKDKLKFTMKDDGQLIAEITFKDTDKSTAKDNCSKTSIMI